jgi:hypothetical protein
MGRVEELLGVLLLLVLLLVIDCIIDCSCCDEGYCEGRAACRITPLLFLHDFAVADVALLHLLDLDVVTSRGSGRH